jgi:hypothetical protein
MANILTIHDKDIINFLVGHFIPHFVQNKKITNEAYIVTEIINSG